MKTFSTQILHPSAASADDPAVRRAADLLLAGEVVALPTETVYGLAADARSPQAAANVFEAKERPTFDPLIVHLPTSGDWLSQTTIIPDALAGTVATLIAKFWPGPLTLLLPKRPLIPDLVTSGSELVAVRMPSDPLFQAVLHAVAGPLAAPSANRFGRVSPTDASAVLEELGGRIPLILDGGPSAHGVESTILGFSSDQTPEIHRPGPIPAEEIATLLNREVRQKPSSSTATPGSMASHYAPATPLRLMNPPWSRDQMSLRPGGRAGVIHWGSTPLPCGIFVREALWTGTNRAASGNDLAEALHTAACRLFRLLREMDSAGLDLILVEPVPEIGIGTAIMDRLRRASARRD